MEEETGNASSYDLNGEDKISRLPDNLIHHIMSYNDTKYAVQTSVLSKRWIDVWKCLPFLVFNRDSYSSEKKRTFTLFVDMVLLFRNEFDIQRFSLVWQNSAYDDSVAEHVTRWSIAAVRYNVKKFSIKVGQCHNSPFEIPHRLLNCKSLRKLEILLEGSSRYVDIVLPRSMNLPRLQELHLIGLSISNVELSEKLISSCPVLQVLFIFACKIQTELIIDSLSLKKFDYVCWMRNSMAKIIKLSAPNLKVFGCRLFFAQDNSLEISSPLSRVRFCIMLKANEQEENAVTYLKLPLEEKGVYAKRMMKFLGAVYMVKFLSLSSGFLEVLSQALDVSDYRPPQLCNLQCLKVDIWFTRGCLRSIAYLLSISPHIASINLTLKESNLADVGVNWAAGLSFEGMLSQLEVVRIEEVEGSDNELKLLMFLLKNAMVLKKVVLYPRSNIDSPDRMMEQFWGKLRALPRVSSCIIMHWPAAKSTHII